MNIFDRESYIKDENYYKKNYTDLEKIVYYHNNIVKMNNDLDIMNNYYTNIENNIVHFFEIPNNNLSNFIDIFANILTQSTYIHPQIKNKDSKSCK